MLPPSFQADSGEPAALEETQIALVGTKFDGAKTEIYPHNGGRYDATKGRHAKNSWPCM